MGLGPGGGNVKHSTLKAWLIAGAAILVTEGPVSAQESPSTQPATEAEQASQTAAEEAQNAAEEAQNAADEAQNAAEEAQDAAEQAQSEATAAAAQTPAAPASTDADEQPKDEVEDILVTGTQVRRTGFDTPGSVASVGSYRMRQFMAGSGSQADILQNLPGVNAEGGGGEVATNFRVRGLPSGGQFEFTPLQVDGVSVFSTFGLNSSAFDFFVRNDLGIDRLEFAKNGVSNLFGAGGQAGVLNYVSKTGTDRNEGTLQLEYAEGNRFRGDVAVQGPISDNTYYAVSGFYRYDEGPLDTGLPTEGFSIRGNVKHVFEDGSGYFQLNGSYINDRAQFYLPVVLDGQSRERIAGNNGDTVFTLNSSGVAGITARSPEGITNFDAGNGFRTVGGHVYAILEKDFGEGWKLSSRLKFTVLDTGSNFFNNGAGVGGGGPFTQAEFLDSRGLSGMGAAAFSYAETGAALGANDLVFVNQFNDRERDATDGTIEINVSKQFELYNTKHTVTLGTFIARAEADNIQRSVRYLADFNNNPALVNVTLANPADAENPLQLTSNGVLQAPSAYANQNREAFRRAVYLADQVQADRWQFDLGFRVEAQTVTNRFEQTQSVDANLASNPVANSAITTQSFGNGNFLEGDATAVGWAIAGAASYLLTDDINLFATGSRGFFFPQAQSTGGQIVTTGDIVVYEEEPILQAGVGVKYRNGNWFSGYIEGFFTGLRDRNNVVFADNSAEPSVFTTSSDTFGVELDARVMLTDYIQITGNFIFQEHKITDGDFDGNALVRLPKVLANLSLAGQYAGFDGAIFWNFNGSAFADPGNGVELDPFSIVRLDLGYTIPIADADTLRLSVNVWNLLDSQGLQEGNPRAGLTQSEDEDAQFFTGRPILPRRITVRMTYDFF